jgi:hypothetical protein
MASNQQVTVGENVQLKSLSDPTINLNAYYQGFVNLQSVEPSLGLPSNNTFTSPNSTYYFPVVTVHPTYGSSRKFTNNGNLLTINKNNIGVGTATPNSKLTVVGDISARGRLYAEDRPYTMLFALSSIKPTKGDNAIYTGIVTVPLYSNIGGGDFNAIDDSLYSTIAGGLVNNIGNSSHFSFIGGGAENNTCGFFSSIVGGECNTINAGDHSVIVGGMCNAMFSGSLGCQNDSSVIVGGSCNTIMGYCGNFIGGGIGNYMDENTACGSILGGWDNCMINGEAAVILGGARNKIVAIEYGDYPEYDELTNDESYSFIGTGSDNYIAGIHSAILAGRQNSLSGSNSFILGSLIKTNIHNTTFVNNLSSQGILHGVSIRALSAQLSAGIVENDFTIFGNLSVMGTRTEINTNVLNTSSLQIINPGIGPALYVQQLNSNYDVAQFVTEYDIPVLTIKNASFSPTARVGINTSDPNKELTVIGDISASGTIYGNFEGSIGDYLLLQGLSSYYILVDTLSATNIITDNLTSTNIVVENLSATNTIIQNFSANNISVDSISAANIPYVWVNGSTSINTTRYNTLSSSANYSNIGGGQENIINSDYTVIAGGYCNIASGNSSTVGGGYGNTANGDCSTISGGYGNSTNGNCSTVGGGSINNATGDHSNIGGGGFNTVSGCYSIIAGGCCNTASSCFSIIAGGGNNSANGFGFSTIAGGRNNTASGPSSTVVGGECNTASCFYSFIGSGCGNIASGIYSTIAGGRNNTANGTNSFIGGGCNNNTNTQANTFILGSNINATQPNYTYVNNLSVQNGLINSPGTQTIISDGINTTGNGDFTLSLNFANGVYVQNDLYLGNGSNNFDAKIQSNVTANRTFGLPDSTGTLMVVTSGIRNFAAPVASSNVATVSRTIQVFDSTGTSIGFIPLYASRS